MGLDFAEALWEALALSRGRLGRATLGASARHGAKGVEL